jgi:Phytanoyl-CoA dioxygenase (PhyH)
VTPPNGGSGRPPSFDLLCWRTGGFTHTLASGRGKRFLGRIPGQVKENHVSLDVEAFRENGYAVVRGAVPGTLCEALIVAIGEVSGLDADRPETWYRDPPLAWDIVPVWGHQGQWDIRQHPALHRVWSALGGTPTLLVTLDRCRFTPPWRDTENPPLSLHWDHNPHDPTLRWIQGVVAPRDTPAGAGCFRCVPTLYRTPGAWMREPILEDGEPSWSPQVDGYEVVEVPAGQGDLIVWESRMPHANSRNTSDRPRLACYVSMNPGTPEERGVTAECARSGTCFPAWRAEPGHGHVERWAPPRLTELGQRLAGLRDWP